MPLGAFQTPSRHQAAPPRSFPGTENQELASIWLCPAPSSTFSAAIQARFTGVTNNLYLRVMQHKEGTWEDFHCDLWLQILLSSFGDRKAPNGIGKISTAEVLRLRANKLCVTRSIGEALRSG
jgi:hypothetical protein